MPRRNFYAVLGVPMQAEPEEIKRAYRRLVLMLHPDIRGESDAQRFREVHEAYEMLSDPDRRRAYDVEIVGTRRPVYAEPPRHKTAVMVPGDFTSMHPSIEELLDHIRQNFFGSRPKSGGPKRRLGLEAILEPEEARFGCRLPLNVPCYVVCSQCQGTGEWWGLCDTCYGCGMVEGSKAVVLDIHPGARDGELYEVDLSDAGIENLVLHVRLVVP